MLATSSECFDASTVLRCLSEGATASGVRAVRSHQPDNAARPLINGLSALALVAVICGTSVQAAPKLQFSTFFPIGASVSDSLGGIQNMPYKRA